MSKNKNKLRRILALTASVAIMGTSIPFNVLAESVYNEQNNKMVIINNDNKEIINGDSGDELELNSNVGKKAINSVKPIRNAQSSYEKQMEIDDPFEYDYAGYVVNNMKITNESDMQNVVLMLVDHIHHDNQKDSQTSEYRFYDSKDISEEINDALNNSINQEELDSKINQIKEKYQMKDRGSGFYNYLSSFTSDGSNIGKIDFNDIKKKQDITEDTLKQYYNNNSLFTFHIGDNFVNDLIYKKGREINFFLTRQRFKEINPIYQKIFLNEYQNKYNSKIHDRWVDFSDQDTQNNASYIPQNIGRGNIENIKGLNNVRIQISNLNNTGILDKTENMFSVYNIIRNSTKSLGTTKVYEVGIFSPSILVKEYEKSSNKCIGDTSDYTISVVDNNKYDYIADSSLEFKDIKKDDSKPNRVMYVTDFKASYDKIYKTLLDQFNEGLREAEKSGEISKEELEESKHYFMSNIDQRVSQVLIDFTQGITSKNNINGGSLNEILEADKPNLQFLADFYGSDKWGIGIPIAKVGNIDTQTEETDYNTIKKDDPTLEEGKTKVVTKGIKGKKVTKITYKVDRATGELTDPIQEIIEDTKPIDEVILVGTKKVESKPEIKPEEKPETKKYPDGKIEMVGNNNIETDHINLDDYLYFGSPYKHERRQIQKVRFDIDDNKYVERKALPIRSDIKTNKSEYPHYIFTIGDMTYIKVTEKGREPRKMDVKPYLKNERTMLPLRYVGEALNADVTWDNNSRTAYFTRDGITARIQIDGNKIELSNGRVFTMDTKPDNINGRIFVPITNVSQVFTLTNGNTTDGIKQNIEWSQQDYTTTVYPNR